MDVENERFAAPGAHHREHALAPRQRIEGLGLRGMRARGTDERMDKGTRELTVGKPGQHGAAIARYRLGKFVLGNVAGNAFLPFLLFRRSSVSVIARMTQDVFHHELGLHAALPVLRHRLEHKVDHGIAAGALRCRERGT